MSGLSFAVWPMLLLAVVAVAAAWWGIRREQGLRRRQLASYGDESLLPHAATLPPERSRLREQGLRAAALVLGVIALARPQWGERPAALAGAGRDVLVLLDLSRSMNASDDSVPRLEQAKQAIAEVLSVTPENRVGLIVFGGSAFVQLPLTGNQAAFRRFLDAASTDDLGDPATSVAGALTAAATAFEHDGERGYQSVLLVSDGESGNDDLGPSLARLKAAAIPVFAVGVGSTEGAPVPADPAEAPEKWHRDHIGRVVISRLDERELRRAAEETRGSYARWPAGAGPLARELSGMDKRPLQPNESLQRVDRYQWPLGLALAAIGLASFPGVVGRRKGRRYLSAAAVVLAIASCSTVSREIRRGELEYEAGRFRASYEAFSRALERSGDPALQLHAGNALYRMRRYEEAARSYQVAAAVPHLRQQSYYNLGNAYIRAAEEAGNPEPLLRQAISAYEEALRLAPNDSSAKWNLELALKRRGDDRESGGSPGRGRSADYGRGNMENSGYEGTPEASVGAMAGGGYGSAEGESAEELSESEARRLLEALEREQLRSHEGRPAPAGHAGERDW